MVNTSLKWIVSLVLTTHPAVATSAIEPVPYLDVQRYLGTWYEIARFPQRFQDNCDKAEARYEMRPDGSISVTNSCMDTNDGSRRVVEGIAEVVDTKTNAKLVVSFLPSWLRWTGIGRGDYWVIDLATDYSFAAVSEPKRKYLWILSRTPRMQRQVFEGITERLESKGYDLSRLIPARADHLIE
jgi:apolipoprotein D and lipocalin family protein